MKDETKKAIVVTGVSSGVGAAIAQYFMDEGYTVFGSVRKLKDAEPLQRSNPDSFNSMVFDVRDRDAIQSAAYVVESTLKEKNMRLAALVNNAGLAIFGPMECLDDQGFEDTVSINLFGTRNVTNAFLPLLRPQQSALGNSSSQDRINEPLHDRSHDLAEKRIKAGVIVNISSLSGILNTPMNGAYCVSKHALESIGEIYRRELYATGIDVCSIRSGPIQSEIWTKNIDDSTTYEDRDYTLMSANAQAIMKEASKKAMPASVIAKLVLDIVERRKCKVAYEVGEGSNGAKILSKFLPVRLADRLIARALLKPRS